MPDTGAPWNIPYVEAADLVSDWPADSLALANAIDAGLDAAFNAGIGSNVVSVVKDDTFTTTSTSYTTVTGLSAAITPSTATSKVLVVANVVAGFDNDGNAVRTGLLSLFRGATNLSNPASPGTNRTLAFATVVESATARESKPYTMVFLDSPATTSSTTYTVEARLGSNGTLFVNRGETYDDNENVAATVSNITLIEVAA